MSKLNELLSMLDERPLRDRIIVFALLLVIVYVLWSSIFQGALTRKQTKLMREITQVRSQTQVFRGEMVELTKAMTDLSHTALKAQKQSLKHEIALLDDKLNVVVVDLMSKKQMMETLGTLLDQSERVELSGLKSLAPEPLIETHEDLEDPNSSQQLYKEGVLLEIESDYFSTIDYLQKLETDNSRFMWESLIYKVSEYPKAKVSIEVTFISEQGK